TEMENCERDKSVLKRRLTASAGEIERQDVSDVVSKLYLCLCEGLCIGYGTWFFESEGGGRGKVLKEKDNNDTTEKNNKHDEHAAGKKNNTNGPFGLGSDSGFLSLVDVTGTVHVQDGSVVSSPAVEELAVAFGNTKDVNVGQISINVIVDPNLGNATDVVVPLESIRAFSEMFDNTAYGFFLGKWVTYPVVANYGRLSYARAIIELWADVELKDPIVVAIPKLVGEGFYTCKFALSMSENLPGSGMAKNLKNPSQSSRGVPKDAEYRKDVSNPNPFDVLNSVENDVDLHTNGGTSNLASKEASSGGYSSWNGKPLENVENSGDHESEDEVKPVDNEMTSFLASKRVEYGTNSLLKQ
ncbi:hypothetical protein Tco_0622306, partial [Tanacetum coccineum]